MFLSGLDRKRKVKERLGRYLDVGVGAWETRIGKVGLAPHPLKKCGPSHVRCTLYVPLGILHRLIRGATP